FSQSAMRFEISSVLSCLVLAYRIPFGITVSISRSPYHGLHITVVLHITVSISRSPYHVLHITPSISRYPYHRPHVTVPTSRYPYTSSHRCLPKTHRESLPRKTLVVETFAFVSAIHSLYISKLVKRMAIFGTMPETTAPRPL